MSLLGDVVSWFGDGENWRGSRGVPTRLAEHLQMSTAAVLTAMLVALPPAVWLGHRRRFGSLAVNVSNIGRAVPSFAILFVGVSWFGLRELPLIGSVTTWVALVALAVPPMVTNAYTALAGVPDELRDAARGTGMAERQALLRVELPIALPLIAAGVRTAAVQVVATATIAAVVGAGGLGRFIIDGRAVRDDARVFAGALLVAGLSLGTEAVLAVLQRLVTPRGLRVADQIASGEEAAAVAATAS